MATHIDQPPPSDDASICKINNIYTSALMSARISAASRDHFDCFIHMCIHSYRCQTIPTFNMLIFDKRHRTTRLSADQRKYHMHKRYLPAVSIFLSSFLRTVHAAGLLMSRLAYFLLSYICRHVPVQLNAYGANQPATPARHKTLITTFLRTDELPRVSIQAGIREIFDNIDVAGWP